MRTILAALDGSPRAPLVIDAAAEIARSFGATVHPFRAVFVPPEFPAAAAGNPPNLLPEHLARLAADDLLRLAERARSVSVGPPIVRVGQPWRLILQVAQELNADLIVIGSHGYQGWDRVLGTTAARVVNHAARSVLVVHGDKPPASR